MLRRLLVLAVCFIVTHQAWANDCPNAQTAKLGFVLERQGTQAEIRPASDQFVQVVNTYPGGRKQDVLYYRGLFAVSRFDDSVQNFNILLSDPRSIFPLDLKARRVLTYAPASPGKVGAVVSLEMTVSGQEELQLGPCTYSVLVIRNRFLSVEGRVQSEYTDLYSPDLGFVLAKRYDEKGGRQTTMKYQSIKPLGRISPL